MKRSSSTHESPTPCKSGLTALYVPHPQNSSPWQGNAPGNTLSFNTGLATLLLKSQVLTTVCKGIFKDWAAQALPTADMPASLVFPQTQKPSLDTPTHSSNSSVFPGMAAKTHHVAQLVKSRAQRHLVPQSPLPPLPPLGSRLVGESWREAEPEPAGAVQCSRRLHAGPGLPRAPPRRGARTHSCAPGPLGPPSFAPAFTTGQIRSSETGGLGFPDTAQAKIFLHTLGEDTKEHL